MLVEVEGICNCIVRKQIGLLGDDVHLMRLLRWKIARKLYLSHFTSYSVLNIGQLWPDDLPISDTTGVFTQTRSKYSKTGSNSSRG